MQESLQHILIVDNDLLFLKHISYLLSEKNYKYTAVSSAPEALKCLNNEAYDLIVSDLFMPGMDGFQFLSQVRTLREYKYTPFIIITSAFHEEVIVKLLTNGADDVIFKPISTSVFFSKIEAAFSRNQFKKDLYNTNFRNNINLDYGTGVYCTNEGDRMFEQANINLDYVFSYEQLLDLGEKKNIWYVVVNTSASWATQSIKKIKKILGTYCPIIILPVGEGQTIEQELIDYTIPPCFHLDKAGEFFDFILQREMKVKTKYINALSLASSRSPFVVDKRVEQKFGQFSISVFHEPLEQIPGGDFYEILTINDDQCVVVFGDVMGKAWDAWFLVPAYIAYVRSVLRFMTDPNLPSKVDSPARILETLNAYLYKDFKLANVFTTLQIVVLNKLDDSVIFASAGALPPFYKSSKSPHAIEQGTSGKLLGLDLSSRYTDFKITLEQNDVFILMTDGYNDISSNNGQELVKQSEIGALLESIQQNQLVSSPYFDKKYKEQFKISFFNDDRTCVMISREQ